MHACILVCVCACVWVWVWVCDSVCGCAVWVGVRVRNVCVHAHVFVHYACLRVGVVHPLCEVSTTYKQAIYPPPDYHKVKGSITVYVSVSHSYLCSVR